MRLRGEMEIMAINMFHADVDKTGTDEQGNKVTTVRCHGKIVTDTTGELKDLVKPLIGEGGANSAGSSETPATSTVRGWVHWFP
jgi:hypothetical protein